MTKRYEEPPLDLELAEAVTSLSREERAEFDAKIWEGAESVEVEDDSTHTAKRARGILRLLDARERFHERLRRHESTKDQAPPAA